MNILNKSLKIWNTETVDLQHVKVHIPEIKDVLPLYSFLSGDIQHSVEHCQECLEKIFEAERSEDFFYDSFGNCCTITIKHSGVTIENEYTSKISGLISLEDMKIILENWIEFIKTRKPVEYSWS
jgi:hypothetical protein